MNAIDREARDAMDTLTAYEARQKRHAAGYAPAPRAKPAGVWSPRMTEQEQRKHEQYVIDNRLPF